jgi:hypothetical protein
VRAVCVRGIMTVIRARAGAIASEFSRFAKVTSFPEKIRDAHLLAHSLKMQRLQTSWQRRLEAEAKICEHAERIEKLSSQKHFGDSAATRPVTEVEGNASAEKARREAVIRKIQNPHLNRTLSVPEASLYFEVEDHTIYRWTNEGKLLRGARRGSIIIDSMLKWEKKRSRKRRSP